MASTITAQAASASIVVSTSQFGAGRSCSVRRSITVMPRVSAPAVSTATWRRCALEQVGVGQGQHGARVVDGGAGDAVVAGEYVAGEERRTGRRAMAASRPGWLRARRRSARGVASSWWVRSSPAITSGPP